MKINKEIIVKDAATSWEKYRYVACRREEMSMEEERQYVLDCYKSFDIEGEFREGFKDNGGRL